MNPIIESLLGMKAFNDQFIAEDLLQGNRSRMSLLADCLQATSDELLLHELILQIRFSIQLEHSILELCLKKDWLSGNPAEQLNRDLKWAFKVMQLAPKPEENRQST
ncbi:hypothetical protein P9847_06865 [Paenibacillus chibensis]|uniref:Uncharacterized protein n=1 Tax=Paenibacillus chibensis TaxID=59846 RepID=A0ABU6PQ70_9BACL|nr:hypothetical protein [Paenibacillus chibensis]